MDGVGGEQRRGEMERCSCYVLKQRMSPGLVIF